MGRNVDLTDNGALIVREAAASGQAAVTIDAPVDLTSGAGAYAMELLDALPAGLEFLKIDAAGKWTTGLGGGGNLDQAYDFGGAGVGRLITADAGAFEVNTPAASGNTAVVIDQDDDQKALDITKDGLGAGDAASILNAGTGRGLFIDQDGAAIAFEIDQDGAAIAMSINQAAAFVALDITAGAAAGLSITQANGFPCISIEKTHAGTGAALSIVNDGTFPAVLVTQDGAGIALDIDQNGGAIALRINQAADTRCISITQEGDDDCIFIDKNGPLTGSPIRIDNAGQGTSIRIIGTGIAFLMDLTQVATANGVRFDQDGNGTALTIDSEATSNPLISLEPVTGNARGDISWSTARTAAPSAPSEGDMWYDATLERWEVRSGFSAVNHVFASRYAGHFGASTNLLIATGAAIALHAHVALTAEGGPGTDTLDTLTSSPQAQIGDEIVLRMAAGNTLITVADSTGNIRLNGGANQALNNVNDILKLMWLGAVWVQVAFSSNP